MSSPALKQTLSRRHFLRNAGIVAGTAIVFPHIIPARALGLNGTVSPSNRIVLGALGMGHGHHNMSQFLGMDDVQVVAVCDLDTTQRAKGLNTINSKYDNKAARGYNDFRDMFAKENLDAVMLAAPDHWHAILAVTAARAGIHVWGEKPLAHTLAEGRAVCNAVRQNNVVWQTGSWQRSVPNFRQAADLVRNGRIGKISRIEVGTYGGFPGASIKLPEGTQLGKPPANLDYELWLGPAPWREYDPRISHFHWRWNLDFGGGHLMDWVGHHVDTAQWAMDLDGTGPVKISGTGKYGTDAPFNAELEYEYRCTYAGGLEMIVSSKGDGTKFIGENGWIHVGRGFLKTSSPEISANPARDDEKHVYRSENHWRNFIDCIKDGRKTITPVETAHRTASIGHLGHIAIRTGRTIHWDPATETIRDDAGATAMLTPKYRAPWKFSDIA